LRAVTEPEALGEVDLCVVTVKSRDTRAAAAALARVLAKTTPIVSFQNGLDNARVLAELLGEERVARGVVVYNVLRSGHSFAQATLGDLFVGELTRHPGELAELKRVFRVVGERMHIRRDIDEVCAGKLLLNLNNGVCAATGLPIAESIASRDGRWLFATCLWEGIHVMDAAGLHPARVTPLPVAWIARSLQLPDAIVSRLARAFVGVDAAARSSTLQDLDKRRPTEIDELNGAIVALAQTHGMRAVANETISSAVHELERAAIAGERLRFSSPQELRQRVVRARRS
jgi:2-dehydropantoate 2-reductase